MTGSDLWKSCDEIRKSAQKFVNDEWLLINGCDRSFLQGQSVGWKPRGGELPPVTRGSAANSVLHLNGIVQPLCNVIKGPRCTMSSAGVLRALALHGWIPKLWPNLCGMWLTEPVSERMGGWERERKVGGGSGCTWEMKGLPNRLGFAMGKSWVGGEQRGPLGSEWSFKCLLFLFSSVKLLVLFQLTRLFLSPLALPPSDSPLPRCTSLHSRHAAGRIRIQTRANRLCRNFSLRIVGAFFFF